MAKASSSQPRTMSIGGATEDLFVRVKAELRECAKHDRVFALPLGEKLHIDHLIETCGGGASNTAVGLARLGLNAHFEGVIGSDQWGVKLLKNLEREGVDARFAVIVEGEVSSFSLILSSDSGERVILYAPGANAHLHRSNFDLEIARQMDWVYLNHIQESAHDIQEDIVSILSREKPGLTWNPGGRQIAAGMASDPNRRLLPFTDILLLNAGEALSFTGAASTPQALDILLKNGVKRVCITDGRNGVTAADGQRRYSCPCDPTATVVDTTGAGDAFGTGITWAILKGLPFSTALKAGTLNAASVVGAFGAQAGLLTETQMLKRLESSRLTVSEESL